MNSGDPTRTFMNVKLMTFEQLYDTDIKALIERERQAAKVPFGQHPDLAEKIQKAIDFSEIDESVARLSMKVRRLQIESALRDPFIDRQTALALLDELAELETCLSKE